MPTVLFVDDEEIARRNYEAILTHGGYEVLLASSPAEARAIVQGGHEIDLVMTDLRMDHEDGLELLAQLRAIRPTLDVIVLTGHAELSTAVEAMKRGATDYLSKDTDYKEILLTLQKVFEKRTLTAEIHRLRDQLRDRYSFTRIVGTSAAIRSVLEIVERVASTESRVLITGETGTGKELIAETIHLNSPRRNMPFVAVNCGAIPEHLQESELFGYVRGAFSGADKDKRGLLESAHGGTVFLDEIGEMSMETQVKLLRVLENGVVQPVGSIAGRSIDIRVIAATNRNLLEAIRDRTFREDLYYRVNVVGIRLPALRDRKEDIPAIAMALLPPLNERTHRHVRSISPLALEALEAYDWPGNIRELKNVLERAMIFVDGTTIELEHLPEELFRVDTNHSATLTEGAREEEGIRSLEDAEKTHILDTLKRAQGNKLLAARYLQIATTTLYRKLRQYGID